MCNMKYLTNTQICSEICIRGVLVLFYIVIGLFNPIERQIQPEELWLYRYPITKSYFSMNCLWIIILSITSLILLTNYMLTKNEKDLEASILSVTLSVALTATLTRLLKFITGKPRPDFFWRCYPNNCLSSATCGGKNIIKEGRQSFPSGHASVSFASFGFLSLYLMGKVKICEIKGCGHSWRLLICLLPVTFASIVGISRIGDYHHHASDVIAGSVLGTFITLICYHFYYPPFYYHSCEVPYEERTQSIQNIKEDT